MGEGEVEDILALLIEMVQTHDFLYDPQSADFKNVLKREITWSKIAGIVNADADECKKMWRNCRDRFNKERRALLSGSGVERSNWRLFDKMRFYAKFAKPRKTYTVRRSATQCVPHIHTQESSSSLVWSSPVEEIWLTDDNTTVNIPTPRETNKSEGVDSGTVDVVEVSRTISEHRNRAFVEYVYALLNGMSEETAKKTRREILDIIEKYT